jgi:hypothetical protein
MSGISATDRLPAFPACQADFVRPRLGTNQEPGTKWDTKDPRQRASYKFRLIVTAFPEPGRIKGYWYQNIGMEFC